MVRFAVRAERAWSVMPTLARFALVVGLVAMLLAVSVAPVFASSLGDTNPFRWK